MISESIEFIRDHFQTEEFIPLHEPCFIGNEKKYLNQCIDTTFVSSVGKFVDSFEVAVAKFTGAKHAVATVNGTSALHVALLLAGVEPDNEVITQALTFVATCNAISYIGANPVFVDVDKENMGLSPEKLESFLSKETKMVDGGCVNKRSNRKIKAIVPMHTFGLPIKMDEICTICKRFNITVVEDSAESMGSYYENQHTGTFGSLGVLSFNGNKTITTGGGGMIITNNDVIAQKAKHLTTTAKLPHRWNFEHDEIAYNYRMPNINAALGCAQMEVLDKILSAKKNLAKKYEEFYKNKELKFVTEPKNSRANYWLNAVVLKDLESRDKFLKETNDNGIMTRPIWTLMSNLDIYKNAQKANLENSLWLEERVVNIPSSAKI